MSRNPKPQRRLTPCHRHPDILTPTGLCAPCLHERLSLLNPTTTTSVPELRRCKTFSDKNRVGTAVEPRRRSCEVRGHDSLFDGGDNEVESRKVGLTCPVLEVEEEDDQNELESRKLGLTCPVLEVEEEGEGDGGDDKPESRKLGLTCPVHDDNDDESVPEGIVEVSRVSLTNNNECEFDFEEGKTMKEFIDLELETKIKPNSNSINKKDLKEIASRVLGAASIFSKKLRKWRKKDGNATKHCDNSNTNGNNVSLGELKLEDLKGRRLSCTQSEVGDFGLGRRSCDSDVRGSVLHGGRASIDCGAFGRKSSDSDPRFSIDLGKDDDDEPRASWDGYLVGVSGGSGKTHGGVGGGGPMVSVIENAMASVYGFDNRVLNDRCSSVMKNTPENGKVSSSPAAIGIFNGTKLLITEKELNEWRLNSIKDDTSSSFETGSKELGSGSGLSVSSSSISKEDEEKKSQSESQSRQWSKLRSFLSLLPRRRKGDNINVHGQEDVITRRDVTNPKDATFVRSYSTSFSSRTSSNVIGSGRVESSNVIVKRRQEVNQDDNGLLRFYLTPLRSRRRNNRLKKSHSLARNVLKLY